MPLEFMTPRCFKIQPQDNVATLLDDTAPGEVQILGQQGASPIRSLDTISLGHKIALCEIAQGAPIIKFNVIIGTASKPIKAGEWVHLHNVTSNFDQRSATLDVHTGAVTDTKYE